MAPEWKPAVAGNARLGPLVTTVVTGIGFAAVLFGFLSLTGRNITMRHGVLWGLAGLWLLSSGALAQDYRRYLLVCPFRMYSRASSGGCAPC